MKEAIINQVMLTFQKAIKKFAKKSNESPENVSFIFRLSTDAEKKVDIFLCLNHEIHSEVASKDIMGMTLNFSGLGGLIMEHIYSIINDFANHYSTRNIEISVYLNREDDELVDFFVYKDGSLEKQFLLQDVLKI
jgi:hypothetical protein